MRFFGYHRQTWNARALVHDMVGERADAAYSRKYVARRTVANGHTDHVAQAMPSLCHTITDLSDSLQEDYLRHRTYDYSLVGMIC